MGTYLKVTVLVIVLLFLTTFGVKNSQPMRLYYYFDIETFELPFFALLYICIAIGIFLGMIVGVSRRFNLGRTVKDLERENRQLKEKTKEEVKPEEPSIPSPIEGAGMP